MPAPHSEIIRRAISRESELILLQNSPASDNIAKVSHVVPETLIDGYLEYASLPGKLNNILNFRRLWHELRNRDFQAAVYLVSSERPVRSVRRDKLFFRSAGISEFYGFHGFSKAELYPVNERGFPAMTESE